WRWSLWIAVIAGIAAIGCAVSGAKAQGHETQVLSFFASGALLLIACLAGVRIWMGQTRHQEIRRGPAALARVGGPNPARHPVRSLLTVGLLASATFLVTAVESFHKEAGRDFFKREGGSGGFRLLAESDVPLFQNLNLAKARADLKFTTEQETAVKDV